MVRVGASPVGALARVAEFGAVTVTTGLGAAVLAGRAGSWLLRPVAGRTAGAARRAFSGAVGVVHDPLVRAELRNLVDPRPDRHHRRVHADVERVHVEVRGLTTAAAPLLAASLEQRFAGAAGISWWHVNAITGRVTVGLDRERRTAADVIAIVADAEREAGSENLRFSRHENLPSDREPLIAAAVACAGDVAGWAVAVAGRALPVPAATKALTAALALVDAQPRLRGELERNLGRARADALLALGNAGAQAFSHGGTSLLVDAGQRLAAIIELRESQRSWRRWDAAVQGPHGVSISDPILSAPRPRPLPAGPIERFADSAATGSIVAAAASLVGKQGIGEAADALLVGVPKASRTSRESFASVLSASLSRQGALALDSTAWRRLDRVSAVVVDASALRAGRALVLAATSGADPVWTKQRLWTAAQRCLTDIDSTGGQEAVERAVTDATARLYLRPHAVAARASASSTVVGPGWHDAFSDGQLVGAVLVGAELRPRADELLAAARSAGLRVVLAGEADSSELRSRADETVPPGESLTAAVRRLQTDGHAVMVISARAYRALAAADVAIGLTSRTPAGHLHVPWTADVVSADLACAQQIVSATRIARHVSDRGRTLAMSASTLGGLLLIAGPRRGTWARSISPITGAAFLGLCTGAWAGRSAAAGLPPETTALLPWHALDADDVLRRLPPPAERPHAETTAASGLGERVRTTLVSVGGAGWGRAWSATSALSGHLREELADPLTPVLTVGAAASAILGAPTDAALVGSVMGVNALVSALQRERAERALRALRLDEQVLACVLTGTDARRLTSEFRGTDAATASVVVPAGQLRAGDVIALQPGDVVPADARLLHVDGLALDESGLTGESVTVDKHVRSTPGAPLGERECMVFDGSVVVAGRGRAVVVAVGAATQAGRALSAVPAGSGATGVQGQLRQLTDKALPLTLIGGGLVTGLGFLRGQQLRAAVADGVAVAVAAVPEGLPLVATVAQLAAARRLSRRGVLVRSSRTVEALGRVDTMCFDKTGTLTEGVLQLVQLADLDGTWHADQARHSPDARGLLRAAARACPDPEDGPAVHATDRAVMDAAGVHLGAHPGHRWDPLEEIPFESNRGYAATLGQARTRLRLVVKGAPEVLLPRCTQVLRAAQGGNGSADRGAQAMTPAGEKAAQAAVQRLAQRGLRVLVVAHRELREAPDDVEAAVEQLTLIGFIGLADTPRPSTGPVIEELTANGISVRMITGDHPVTARAIAEQLGIAHEHVVTGAELDALDETARAALIDRSTVFARVTPEHKVRIVEALQRAGRVVAMTGDGSNDAAAIRLADVGIGLATHGSAAARNAADLVLTTPDLTLLLDALVEGRMMWQRVRDSVGILVGGNAGEVVFTILGTALSGRAPVSTRQFLLVNLLTDMFPAMAVALAHPRALLPQDPTETERGAAERRAADVGAELSGIPLPELGGALLHTIAVRGTATAAGAAGAWLIGRGTGTQRRAGTMGLAALVGTQLGQTVLVGGRSPLVWATAVGSGAALIAVIQTPGVSHFFGCTPLDPVAWTVVAATSAAATTGSLILPRLIPMPSQVRP